MKLKNTKLKFIISVCCSIIFCSLILSACSSNDISKCDQSIALIKNATMSTYGTGFAVGKSGDAVDTIITSYSVVATLNGVAPKTAEIRINQEEQKMIANVVYYDVGRNLAILKLPKKTKELRPMFLKDSVNFNEKIYVRGYDGTGNIMSDYEKFNTTDIIQYAGNISTYDELNTIVVYKYSNEFNRALVGSPAVDENGNSIGMCAYSLNSMNTYSQYILSADEIINCLLREDIDFMTSDEVKYRNIMLFAIILGAILFALIIIFTILYANQKENNLKFKDKYIRVTSGTLKDSVYKFEGKLSIGRDSSKCEIVYPVDEPGISALHCTIQMQGKDCYLVDNFSKYGTYLDDGTKVQASTPYKIEKDKFAFYIAERKNSFEFIDKKEI